MTTASSKSSRPTRARRGRRSRRRSKKRATRNGAPGAGGGWAIAGRGRFRRARRSRLPNKSNLANIARMKTWRKIWLIAGGCLALASGTVFGQENANGVLFPKDKPVMEIDFPTGFKAAFRKDGTYLAVGP